jgi:hypothetical protein
MNIYWTTRVFIGVTAMYFVAALVLAQPTKVGQMRLAGDGVNVETYQGNGVWTTTLAQPILKADDSASSLRSYTEDDFVRQYGRWPLTKSEAQDIVKAIRVMWGQTQPEIFVKAVYETEAARLRRMADEAEQREKDRAWALAVMERWEKRADRLKD